MDNVVDTSVDTTPDPEGEVGAARGTRRGDLADLRLFRLALAQAWVVPPAVKQKAVRRMTEILDDEDGRDRAWTAAARTLMGMTTATTSAIQAAVAVHQATELAVRVAELESRVGGGQRLHRAYGEGGEADEQPEDAP